MTNAQLQFIMTGKSIIDINLFATSQSGRIYVEKYKNITIDYTNGLIKLEGSYGVIEYYAISEIIGVVFKSYDGSVDYRLPTGKLEYSTTEPTNGNVIVTFIPNKDNIIVTNNDGEFTYTFTENGVFVFRFKDSLDQVGSLAAAVSNIDKIAPTGTIEYSTEEDTTEPVIATLIPSEPVTVTNNDGEFTYTFIENGEFTFTFIDNAGNTGSTTAVVNNIIE